eukprot:15072497-Alexandrium_andersonii.AAC.1
MPIDWRKKPLAVKTKVWPMALCSCEATAWPKAVGKQVAAQALNVLLGARAAMRHQSSPGLLSRASNHPIWSCS